jgi:hypothetical protein
MPPIISLCLIKLSLWTTTYRRRKIAREGSMVARVILNLYTRNTIFLKAVVVVTFTNIVVTLTGEMVTIPMAIDTMEDLEETIPMVITMEIMVSTVTTQSLRRISRQSPASNARRMVIMQTHVQRRSPVKSPSPIRFRRDM